MKIQHDAALTTITMPSARKYTIALTLIGLLLLGFSREVLSSALLSEQHIGIRDGYIYVLPLRNAFFKIEEENGSVVWKSPMAWRHEDGSEPSQSGWYTSPVFVDNKLIAIATLESTLFVMDCDTGRIELERPYGFFCSTAETVRGQLVCDDLILILLSSGVQAVSVHDLEIKWKLTCEDDNFNGLSDYFRVGESLYLLAGRPSREDKSSSHWPVVDELLELNCATGEEVGRYGWDSLYGEAMQQMLGIKEIGEWKGNRLILLMTYDPGRDVEGYALCSFNPVSESMNLLIDELIDPRDHATGHRIDTSEALASEGLFFYSYTVDADRTLVAWNLADGKVQWKQCGNEYLHIAESRTLFTVEESKRHSKVICRDAATGDVRWKRKLEKPTEHSGIWEMKLSGGRLYVLTNDFLYALGAENGEDFWRVEIYSDQEAAQVSKDSFWSRFLKFFE